MTKVVVWLIGSNGVGKTTQTKSLLKMGSEDELNVISGNKKTDQEFRYTKSGFVAALGTVSDKDCCGCDTLKNKAQIRLSYLNAIDDKDVNIVVIDGIMSTNTWIEFIRERDVKLIVVHFSINLENNVLRVLQRRGIESLDDIEDEKLMSLASNLEGKIGGFKKQFTTQKNNADASLEVEFDEDRTKITEKIIDLIYEFR